LTILTKCNFSKHG